MEYVEFGRIKIRLENNESMDWNLCGLDGLESNADERGKIIHSLGEFLAIAAIK